MTHNQGPILLIENNLFLGGILSDKLKASGLTTITTKDGKKGLDVIVKEDPLLVLLDLPLSEVAVFFGVLRRLKKDKSITPPPVVVLANSDTVQDIQQLKDMGATAYLVKAFSNTEEIVEKIESILQNPSVFDSYEVLSELSDAPKGGDLDSDPRAEQSRSEKSEGPMLEPSNNRSKQLKAKIEKLSFTKDAADDDEIDAVEESVVLDIVDAIIEYAYLIKASDIHFKPEEEVLLVRLRVDGVLRDAFKLPRKIQPEVITRIKVLAGMRTDEHQAAQDGRFTTKLKNVSHQFDMRVSIVPTYHGEDAVLRLLVEQSAINDISDMPLSDRDRDVLLRAVEKPYGMILATGPTGSGKTTTLYTILKKLNTKDVSIITIEDPIEYALTGINQIQVNTRTSLTFANGLRSILRQDPDIIMVGEIRDKETAGIAVNAALTGHKLLSTLHTNDAATTLPRLLDMGVEPFLIASTVNLAIGQRLVRKLCESCRVKRAMTNEELKSLSSYFEHHTQAKAKQIFDAGEGCEKCNMGYSGRVPIFEMIEVDDDMRKLILARADASDIRIKAREQGMTTMFEDGYRKVLNGDTSISEILRVIRE